MAPVKAEEKGMDFTRQIAARRRRRLENIFRRIEEALQPFAYALDWFLATLFSGRLPSDWRQQWHAFVAEQAALGFTVLPQSVGEIEDWIEAWARFCELLPITESQAAVKAESVIAYRPLVADVVPNVSPPPAPPETDGMSVEERNHFCNSRGAALISSNNASTSATTSGRSTSTTFIKTFSATCEVNPRCRNCNVGSTATPPSTKSGVARPGCRVTWVANDLRAPLRHPPTRLRPIRHDQKNMIRTSCWLDSSHVRDPRPSWNRRLQRRLPNRKRR
jgi:hypothetical protein